MNGRDGNVMYELDKERRVEILAKYGSPGYRKLERELPGFKLIVAPRVVAASLIILGLAAAVVFAAQLLFL